MSNIYNQGLDKVAANSQPLTPINFLNRTADVYPDKVAIIHGKQKITYQQYRKNVRRLASSLIKLGVKPGQTVSIMAANIPEFLDAHFAVPQIGAVLNAINIRLDAHNIAFILDHGECDVLLTDTAFSSVVKEALAISTRKPLIIDIDDSEGPGGEKIGTMDYQELLAQGDENFSQSFVQDEWQALALNYTSGTTGNPKGVVYSHRGAYLNSIGHNFIWPTNNKTNYLWTLPMFHCNGWCFPWTIVAVGARKFV
nr:AMP-binding protein [Colwellia sp. Arc7-D]